MHLATPQSAILSAVIFNALIIVFLIPLALRGVTYHQVSAASLLRSNVFIYGLGGLIVPFIGIKLIDLIIMCFAFILRLGLHQGKNMFSETIKQIKICSYSTNFINYFNRVIYPILSLAIAQLFFPWQANGSLITQNNK